MCKLNLVIALQDDGQKPSINLTTGRSIGIYHFYVPSEFHQQGQRGF